MNFISTNPLSDSANYAYVKSKVDVQSFMLHYLLVFTCRAPTGRIKNEAKWRPKTVDGKWKWIMWDMDATVAYYLNPGTTCLTSHRW
ncbi:MAG: CotH kinase family protein [Bacteroidetes bacterium]|nr:CotH kinase family protein [Bacteroidota bacterium]